MKRRTERLCEPSVVTFGSFDGLHRGHRAVLEKLCEQAGCRAVLSYEEVEHPVIYTEIEKAHLLASFDFDAMVSIPRSEVESLTSEEFADQVLKKRMRAHSVVVGNNIRFGRDQADLRDLEVLGEKLDFQVISVPTVHFDGGVLSADSIRQSIENGDFVQMESLLGHPYLMYGTVVHGKAAGRKFGMPTANLGVAPNKLLPPHGVYGTLSYMDDGVFPGMTNVGLRPSDDDIPIPSIETFLLNFDRDIYGKDIYLEFHVYTRGVKKFPGGLAELRKQIDRDIENVREYMGKVKPRKV